MKVAYAPAILTQPETRNETATALKAGETIVIHAGEAPAPQLSPEMLNAILLGGSGIGTVKLTPQVKSQLNMPGIAVGGVGGTVIGAGIGMVFDQIKQMHPHSAVIFDAGAAMIGGGLGALVGSGLFEAEPGYDGGKWSLKLRLREKKS